MVASDIIAIIRQQVTEGLQIEREEQDRIVIYTPFMYQDGDHCSFVIVRDPSKAEWYLTDEGEVCACGLLRHKFVSQGPRFSFSTDN